LEAIGLDFAIAIFKIIHIFDSADVNNTAQNSLIDGRIFTFRLSRENIHTRAVL